MRGGAAAKIREVMLVIFEVKSRIMCPCPLSDCRATKLRVLATSEDDPPWPAVCLTLEALAAPTFTPCNHGGYWAHRSYGGRTASLPTEMHETRLNHLLMVLKLQLVADMSHADLRYAEGVIDTRTTSGSECFVSRA